MMWPGSVTVDRRVAGEAGPPNLQRFLETVLRVIHLANHCNHGHGNAHIAIDLACSQSRAGYSVGFASAGGDYEALLERSGVHLFRILQKTSDPLSIIRAVQKLRTACKTFGPDLLHAHMMSGALIGYATSRLQRTPLLSTLHNSFDAHSALMCVADRVVVVSKAEESALVRRGFPRHRTELVINGPNESPRYDWWKEDQPLDLTEPCITTICGLHRRKGVVDVLRAFSTVATCFPDWFLNIVGDGPDRNDLETMSAELGLNGRARFLGNVWRVRPILERSAIFVIASYAEPCSLAIAEARFAGCAVIGTAVGGTPELLDGGNSGILVPPASPEAIALELKGLMGDPNRLNFWRKRAKLGCEYLSNQRMFRDYDAVYHRLVSNDRN